jgi:hypothetical protein
MTATPDKHNRDSDERYGIGGADPEQQARHDTGEHRGRRIMQANLEEEIAHEAGEGESLPNCPVKQLWDRCDTLLPPEASKQQQSLE